MDENFYKIQELLRQRAEINARLALLPYDGSPEIKESNGKKYLYVRKRIASRLTSTYVDVYSDELYELLLRNQRERRELNKISRSIDRELALLGYTGNNLSPEVRKNQDFARVNMKQNIYDQAVLEGVATSFPQTEEIINNGIVNGMTPTDIQKVLNLKHAWEFILDDDVLSSPSGYYVLCHIAKLVNEGFFAEGGRIRGVPVTIGGLSYIPPLPVESTVRAEIDEIINGNYEAVEKGIRLCLYCMKTQIFLDGNKRAAVIFANHFLISHAAGMLIIPENIVPKFKKMLVSYYENKIDSEMVDFMYRFCVKQ